MKKIIWDRVETIPESGCWIWMKGTSPDGYGKIKYKQKTIRAHRFSWMAHRGKIPKWKFVLHKCDIKLCVNPDHLFIGTNDDNMKDMVLKKRHRIGSQQVSSKLTENQVRDIKNHFKNHSTRKIAKIYGVGQVTIMRIKSGTHWTHVK